MIKILLTTCFLASFSVGAPYTSEQLHHRLDSLYDLRRAAMETGGNESEFAAEIEHVQTAIETVRRNEGFSDNGVNAEKTTQKTEDVSQTFLANFLKNFKDFSFLDKLVIIMGAIAVLAAIFLLLMRIVLGFSRRKKTKRQAPAPKNPPFPEIKEELTPKAANAINIIDRYKERAAATTPPPSPTPPPLTSSQPTPEEPKKMRALEVKNEIVKKFDNGEDTAKIAQDFSMSQDQIIMILNLAGRK